MGRRRTHLPLPENEIAEYRAALIERYENPNIRHLLAQIAGDGSQRIAIRIVPALKAEAAAGGDPSGASRAVAAWILHLRGLGAPVNDAAAEAVTTLAAGPLEDAVAAVLAHLGITEDGIAALVTEQARELESLAR